MFKAAAGLAACGALYLTAIYAFVWFGNRRIEWASSRGVALGPKPSFPSAREIWSRHRVEMTVTYGICFLALALADFSLWQRVGFAGLAALVFGSFWISNSRDRIVLDAASPARKTASSVGYWFLSVADWFGYLGILCFGTALLVEAF
jgi:glycerol uptake facilitator-like aquaporin